MLFYFFFFFIFLYKKAEFERKIDKVTKRFFKSFSILFDVVWYFNVKYHVNIPCHGHSCHVLHLSCSCCYVHINNYYVLLLKSSPFFSVVYLFAATTFLCLVSYRLNQIYFTPKKMYCSFNYQNCNYNLNKFEILYFVCLNVCSCCCFIKLQFRKP